MPAHPIADNRPTDLTTDDKAGSRRDEPAIAGFDIGGFDIGGKG